MGGEGDVACSGDLLIGALAACQETTIRMVAANMGIELESLRIEVEADWDARGTLAMGAFPIGLTGIRCRTSVRVPDDVQGEWAERLLRSRKILRRSQHPSQRRSGGVDLRPGAQPLGAILDLARGDQARLVGHDDGLDAIVDLEFLQHVGDVRLHGRFADHQLFGEVVIVESASHQA